MRHVELRNSFSFTFIGANLQDPKLHSETSYCSLSTTSVPTQDNMVQRPSFTQGDGAALARSKREASTRHEEQNSPMFWSSLASFFEDQIHRSHSHRESESLQAR